MKTEIHPEYMDCKVNCACGNSFVTRATRAQLSVDICNECHPFFTGEQRIIDTEGRVERLKRRYKLG